MAMPAFLCASLSLFVLVPQRALSQVCDPADAKVQICISAADGSIDPNPGAYPWWVTGHWGGVDAFNYGLPGGCSQVALMHDGHWTFSGIGGHYLRTPHTEGADCVLVGGCLKCTGRADLDMYSNKGGFSGSVTLVPSGGPAAGWPVYFEGIAYPGWASTSTDANGHYRMYGPPGQPNYWGVGVYSDGSGPGSGTYNIHTDYTMRHFRTATTYSNFDQWVELLAYEPGAESPDIRCPEGACCQDPGKPVSLVTGNMYLDQQDAVLPGVAGSLKLVRSYNSANRGSGQYGMFGPGWSSNYEQRLTPWGTSGKALVLRQANGVVAYYNDPDADLRFDASVPYTRENWIVKQGDGSYIRHFRKGGSETYSSAGRLTSLVDVNGNTTTLTYDGSSRLATIADAGGRGLTLGYTGSSAQPSTLSGPAGLIATYTYESGVLKTVTHADGPDADADPDGGYTFTYVGGKLTTVADRDGQIIESHDYVGDRASTSAVSGDVEKYTLDYQTNKTIVTSKRVATDPADTTTYEYSSFNGMRLVTKATGACGSCGSGSEVREWTYDDKGRVLTYKDGAGSVTTYTYDPATGDLLTESRVADPANPSTTTHTTTYTYYPDGAPNYGRMHTKTEPNGQVTTWTYVAPGPATITETVSATEARTTSFTYTSQGQLQTVTDPRLKITTNSYNPVGDLEWVRDPMAHQASFQYDDMGRRTQTIRPTTTPPNADPVTTYDTLGRVHRITNPDGTYTEFTYDGGGRRTSVRDFLGKITTYHYDPYGRLDSVTDPATGVTGYGYDLMSHLTSITDARGKTTSFEVDAFGRVKKVTYPGARIEEFTYDGAGRLKTRKDRKGVTTTYTYDGLGRLTQKAYDNGAPAVTFTYDQGSADHKGRLTTAANATDTLSWTYDLAGQVGSESSAFNATAISYGYDPAGNRGSSNLNGRIVGYDYDDDGKLSRLTWPTGSLLTDTYTFGYDEADRRRSLSYPDGWLTSYTPDLLSRLETVQTARLWQTQTLASATYGYDAVGNRTSKTDEALTRWDYEYDNLYRLSQVDQTANCRFCLPHPVEKYQGYDGVGNRYATATKPWTYSDRNELLSGPGTLTYDLNGNLATKIEGADTWTYEWSVENQLTRVVKNGAEVASFLYDPLGRRVQKIAGGVTRKFTYDGEDILREKIIGVGNLRYIHGPGIDEPLAVENISNGAMTYYHADGLGSIVKTTDSAGTVTLTRTYDSFGIPSDGATTPGYAYTGREWDPETGLYYYRARYYDPKVGRFLGEDPLPIAVPGFRGSSFGRRSLPAPAASTLASLSLVQQAVQQALGLDDDVNRYTYVGDNPVNYVDPSGESKIPHKILHGLHWLHAAECVKESLDCTAAVDKRCGCLPDFQQTCRFNGYDCCNSASLHCMTFGLLGTPGPCS